MEFWPERLAVWTRLISYQITAPQADSIPRKVYFCYLNKITKEINIIKNIKIFWSSTLPKFQQTKNNLVQLIIAREDTEYLT